MILMSSLCYWQLITSVRPSNWKDIRPLLNHWQPCCLVSLNKRKRGKSMFWYHWQLCCLVHRTNKFVRHKTVKQIILSTSSTKNKNPNPVLQLLLIRQMGHWQLCCLVTHRSTTRCT